MSRDRHSTNWWRIRWLIESNLREHPDFPDNFRIEGKIRSMEHGLFHRSYLFEDAERYLVLRLGYVANRVQTKHDASVSLQKEAETLKALTGFELPFIVPKLISLVKDEDDETVGLIETVVPGMSLKHFTKGTNPEWPLQNIASVAAYIHTLPVSAFKHLKVHVDAKSHATSMLDDLPERLFTAYPEFVGVRDWILGALTNERPATLLHGDLFPQNLQYDLRETHQIGVVDWEDALIGDPAYEIAIFTGGERQPHGVPNGFMRSIELYNEKSERRISAKDVMVYALLIRMNWLADAIPARFGGTNPEHYVNLLRVLFRRASALK